MNKRQQAEHKGRRAEWLASWVLRFKGYRVLKQRYKTPVGEIDIVAFKNNCLIAIEVKARKEKEQGKIALTRTQRQRIEKAAALYAGSINHTGPVRFDVMLKGDNDFFITHIKAAWREGE